MRTLQINDTINMDKGFSRVPNNVIGLLEYKEVGLKVGDITLYAVLLNRLQLSLANADKYNTNGEVYVVYEQKELGKTLGLSHRGVIDSMKRLEAACLIKVSRHGKNKPNTYSFYDVFSTDTESLKSQIVSSRTNKMLAHELTNCYPIKNDYINTDYIKIKDTAMPEQPTETKASPAKEKEDKRYTALRDGGTVSTIYANAYEQVFGEAHKDVEENELKRLEGLIEDFIEEHEVDYIDFEEMLIHYFKNLKNKNNGTIHYLAKENHGYVPLLKRILDDYTDAY